MKVTLVSPPYTFWKPGTEFLAPLLGHYPPMGLLSLAAYVREHLDASLIDAVRDELARLKAGTDDASEITWRMRRLVLRRPDAE